MTDNSEDLEMKMVIAEGPEVVLADTLRSMTGSFQDIMPGDRILAIFASHLGALRYLAEFNKVPDEVIEKLIRVNIEQGYMSTKKANEEPREGKYDA